MEDRIYVPFATALRDVDSPFVETAAVDAWDAWFRWRDHGVLRDLTVDATWDRVATALTSVESTTTAPIWKRRFTDAFDAWRLLLDERIFATAGTGEHKWHNDGLVAALNVAAFVRAPLTSRAAFDQTGIEDVAALAVRALDDARVLVGNAAAVNGDFRIGMVGLADALTLLGLAYDSADGRAQATFIAQALAQGCLRGSLQLVRERGATAPCTQEWRARAQAKGVAAELVDEAARHGIRHRRLTAITSQRKLALLANNVADALDPLIDSTRPEIATVGDAQRGALARGYAPTPSVLYVQPAPEAGKCSVASVTAQLELRAAVQPWIDDPITYPLLVDSEPDEQLSAQWTTMATERGLPKPGWRRPDHRASTRGRHPLANLAT
jgi:ribonucleoside-diphosphate reductase alpha chain